MGGRLHGRPCPRRLIVGQLRALRRNCAVHHLSPSQCVPIRKAIANAVNAAFIAPPTTQGLGLRSTSHPAEPQHRDSVDIAGFLGYCHATRSGHSSPQRFGDATQPAEPGERSGVAGLGGPFATPLPFGPGPARLARSNVNMACVNKASVADRAQAGRAAVPIFSPWGPGLFHKHYMYNFPWRTFEIVGGPAQNRFHLPREERPRFSVTAWTGAPRGTPLVHRVAWGETVRGGATDKRGRSSAVRHR